MRYSRTVGAVELISGKHVSLANKHILASVEGDGEPEEVKKPGNSVIIQQANSDDAAQDNLRAPSKESGIFLTSRNGSISLQATDSKKRSLILGDKGLLLAANAALLNEKPQVFLSDDAVHVKFGDSFVQIKRGEISLRARQDANDALVHLSGGKVGIYSSGKGIVLDQATINGDKIAGVADIGSGSIKIIGPPVPATTPAATATAPTLDDDKRTMG
jgi:hypothetical protein